MNIEVQARLVALIRLIPKGQVASYGQLGKYIGLGARQVGRLMTGISGRGVPWHRVVNAGGGISLDPAGAGARQRRLLEREGVVFSAVGRLPMRRYRWPGPDPLWLAENSDGVTL